MSAPPYYYSHLATPSTPNHPPSCAKCCSPCLHDWSTQHTIPLPGCTQHTQHTIPSPGFTHHDDRARYPRLAPPASTVYYAVGGGAIVHSDLTSALAQFTAMSSRGPAELLTTEDARQATHFASGFPRAEAALISQAERASDITTLPIGPTSPIWHGVAAETISSSSSVKSCVFWMGWQRIRMLRNSRMGGWCMRLSQMGTIEL
ncbi:hypothetical protein B0H14DRAFT_2637625 [Mycena olivaceomarginata]|nr:hypothetical protein B0H14DRAFT_2637625 [Mycena olivaceomarginata]